MTTTTNTAQGLLTDILEHPEADDLRLIFADWLDDHDEEERAEFIRVQVELHEPRRQWETIQREGCKACHDRRLLLSRGAGGQLMPGSCRRCDDLECYVYSRENIESRYLRTSSAHRHWAKDILDILPVGTYIPDAITFRRGFIAEVHAPLAVLQQHLPALVRCHPIERVRATDKEPDHYAALSDLWPEHWSWWSNNDNDPSSVQKQVWNLLDGFGPGYTSMDEECRNYPTAEAAHDALSVALLTLARR